MLVCASVCVKVYNGCVVTECKWVGMSARVCMYMCEFVCVCCSVRVYVCVCVCVCVYV